MPPVYPKYKDPLWPEPPQEFRWPGGRALAPWKPPAPPLPPPPGTPEEETYLTNPKVQGVKPPKGDVETGQPIGPMFTKMPRDAQRAAVDQTFRQISRGPKKKDVEGVLGEGYAALRTLSEGKPELAEKGVVQSIVVPRNPIRGFSQAELAAQALWQRMNPKLFRAMAVDKRPGGQYRLDLTKSSREKGYTVRPKETGGPIDVRINPSLAGPETFPHEASHAFALRKAPQGIGSQPRMGGFHVLDPEVQEAYMRMAGGDPYHAATYYRADEAAKRTGRVARSGTSLLKSYLGKSPEGPAR